MPCYRFDIDTASAAIDDGHHAVDLHAEWNVDGRILNGGYLQAVAVRAAAELCGTTPVAVSTHYVATPAPGPAVVEVAVLRSGSTITSATASLHQEGATVLVAQVSMAATRRRDLPAREASYLAGEDPGMVTMPVVTGPDDSLRPPRESMPGPPGLTDLIDYAFVPEASGWLRGDYSAGPQIGCWLSFRDGRPVDRLAALAFVDIAPPVCFALGQFGWAPTLQLQTGIFADPAPGPMLLMLSGSPYSGPIVAEDAMLWDSAGTLVARSRQIAMAPRR